MISRRRIFSTWTIASKSCQFNVINCHKTLSKRNLSYKTGVIASFIHSNVFWNTHQKCQDRHNGGCDFRFRFIIHLGHRIPCTGWRMIWNLLGKFFTPVRFCSVDNELIGGNTYAKQQLWRCSVSMFSHLLFFSKLLGSTHLLIWIEDVRSRWD